MNTKDLIKNRGLLAIILGVAVIATVGGLSVVYAASGSNQTQNQTPPQIQGSVNLQQMLMSSVKVKFTDAANAAANAQGITNGQVISGGLQVIQGSVVYNFKVTDGTKIYSVIVDAGNGSILYTSTGHPLQLGSLLGMGHYGMGGHCSMGAHGWKSQQATSGTTSPPTGNTNPTTGQTNTPTESQV